MTDNLFEILSHPPESPHYIEPIPKPPSEPIETPIDRVHIESLLSHTLNLPSEHTPFPPKEESPNNSISSFSSNPFWASQNKENFKVKNKENY